MLDKLPEDIKREIASHLPPISLARFFATCKSAWNLRSGFDISKWKTFYASTNTEQHELVKLAAMKNDPELVALYLRHLRNGSTSWILHEAYRQALKGAAESGNKKLLEKFVAQFPGYSINWASIMESASLGGHLDLVRMCYLNGGSSTLESSVVAASSRGHKDIVEFFVHFGASNWQAGLDAASEGGHKELVDYFISKGASNISYAVNCAAKGGHTDLVKYLFDEKGAPLTARVGAIQCAALAGRKQVVEYLLDKFEFAEATLEGAVVCAATKGSTEIVELMFQRGFAKDWEKALMCAAKYHHQDVLESIVQLAGNNLSETKIQEAKLLLDKKQ